MALATGLAAAPAQADMSWTGDTALTAELTGHRPAEAELRATASRPLAAPVPLCELAREPALPE
ncbi:hypothetical protein [Streptomyces litchfieldiae]|uniref:Uncharacterized protein n=1 Tax=Streptomyces litchfieldiae TaxID=3075543 RepID=A0ABU2MU37_9ACTN|nr:hypothetical protein [Streptomyces sp. DSM 44938]MDT0345157.1 hypothetical protein [Streptomyces sp. DSM 44938]